MRTSRLAKSTGSPVVTGLVAATLLVVSCSVCETDVGRAFELPIGSSKLGQGSVWVTRWEGDAYDKNIFVAKCVLTEERLALLPSGFDNSSMVEVLGRGFYPFAYYLRDQHVGRSLRRVMGGGEMSRVHSVEASTIRIPFDQKSQVEFQAEWSKDENRIVALRSPIGWGLCSIGRVDSERYRYFFFDAVKVEKPFKDRILVIRGLEGIVFKRTSGDAGGRLLILGVGMSGGKRYIIYKYCVGAKYRLPATPVEGDYVPMWK